MNKSVRGVLKIGNFVLLIKRKKNNKLYFVFPGGHKRRDESDADTCKREFKEETNLDIIPKKHINDIEESSSFTTSYYLCSLKEITGRDVLPQLKMIGPETEKDQLSDFYKPLWVKIDELEGKTIYPKSIVNMIINGKI